MWHCHENADCGCFDFSLLLNCDYLCFKIFEDFNMSIMYSSDNVIEFILSLWKSWYKGTAKLKLRKKKLRDLKMFIEKVTL